MQKKVARNVQNRGLRSKVLEYLHKKPDCEVWFQEIAAAIGSTEAAVRNCVGNLVLDGSFNVERVVRGRSCIYRSKPQVPAKPENSKRLFEELATTKAGEVLVQDETGVLYLLREL